VAVLISVTTRLTAFNLAIAGWLPCGLMFILAGLTISKDEAAVQRQLSRVAQRAMPANDGFLANSALEGLATPALSQYTEDSQTPTGLRAAIELGPLGGGSAESKRGVPPSVTEDAPLLGER
jgi:hypothetical protein